MALVHLSPIALPYSGELPTDLPVGGSANTYANSAGPMRGNGDDIVYQMEMKVPGSPIQYLPMTLARNLTQGDLVIRYSDLSEMETFNNSHKSVRVSVGISAGAPNGLALSVGRTNNATQARSASFNNGADVTTFFPNAWAAKQVRFIRVNWTASTFRAKGWDSAVAEPSAWAIEVTSGITIAQGDVRLEFIQGAQTVNFHWASYSDVAATPGYKATIGANDATTLPSGNKTITFTAQRSDGSNLLGQKSFLYHQATGLKLAETTSDSSSGVVSFSNIPTEDICYALTHDSANTLDSIQNFLNKQVI